MKLALQVLMLLVTGLISTSVDQAAAAGSCRSLNVSTDKETYAIGENVAITVEYVHLLPGCVEVQVLHDHLISIEIIDQAGEIRYFKEHVTKSNLTICETWNVLRTGDYSINVTSWFRLSPTNLLKECEASRRINVKEFASIPEFADAAWGLIMAFLISLTVVAVRMVKRPAAKTLLELS